MIQGLEIKSPKRNGSMKSEWDGFFPYYAGYPVDFAQRIIESANLSDNATVFDPWNGSGTTTFAASQLGFKSRAFDLNPAMIVVARSRLLPPSEADSLMPLAKKLIENIQPSRDLIDPSDPLLVWFHTKTATIIRTLERRIFDQLVGNLTKRPEGMKWENMSGIASTFYVVLFSVCRNLVSKFLSSNPTWLRQPKSSKDRIKCQHATILRNFIDSTSLMAAVLVKRETENTEDTAHAILTCADTSRTILDEKSIDFVLTSPPYCTRIDYGVATRIELAILAPFQMQTEESLRHALLGSTLSPKQEIHINDDWGPTCGKFISDLKSHSSKASTGYYLRTHLDYFDKIHRSISNISHCMKNGSGAVFVVQDSYYKDIHNDLPTIISEIASSLRLDTFRRENYRFEQSRSRLNPHTRQYRTVGAVTESVLCFQKADA